MLLRPDIESLVAAVAELVENAPHLEAMQRGAFDAAEAEFDWADRGEALRAAIIEARFAASRRGRGSLPGPDRHEAGRV
jgi:glycosyltransferase involved in cell wall biosynthesis